jgi:hypothetical protein
MSEPHEARNRLALVRGAIRALDAKLYRLEQELADTPHARRIVEARDALLAIYRRTKETNDR